MAKKSTTKKPARKRSPKKANDALSVIHRRYYEGNPKRQVALEKARGR